MERLTANDLNKTCYDPWELCGMDSYCKKGCHEEGGCTKGCHILKMYRKLAEYEELEEQGRLLKLPFSTGDEVCVIEENKIFRCKVIKIEVCNKIAFAIVEKNMIYERNMGYIRVPIGNFGKTVFLTRLEAEQALAEMEGKK